MRAIKIITAVLLVLTAALFVGSGVYVRMSGLREGPVLQGCAEPLEISIHAGEEVLLAGVTASDAQDGDLTENIIVGGVSALTGENGAKVRYMVFDSHGNMDSVTRELHYTDYRRPAIQVRAPLRYASVEDVKLLERVTAVDLVDGDLTDQVRVSTLWKTDREDVYSVTVMVTNSLGDTATVELPVIICPEGVAGVELRRQVLYLDVGAEFDPMAQIMSADSLIEARSEVDTSTPGCYWVWYFKGDGTVFSILTVIVE